MGRRAGIQNRPCCASGDPRGQKTAGWCGQEHVVDKRQKHPHRWRQSGDAVFARKPDGRWTRSFWHVMIQATDRVGPAYKYSWAAGKIVNLGLLQQEDANSQSHVTGHTWAPSAPPFLRGAQESPKSGEQLKHQIEKNHRRIEVSACHRRIGGGYFNLARASVSLASRYSP